MRFLPTGRVRFLPTGRVRFLPTGRVRFLPTGRVRFLPTGRVRFLPSAVITDGFPRNVQLIVIILHCFTVVVYVPKLLANVPGYQQYSRFSHKMNCFFDIAGIYLTYHLPELSANVLSSLLVSRIYSILHNYTTIIFCHCWYGVPARLRKGQGAKEIGHNLARERPKFGHNFVRKRHKIFYV